MQSLEKRLDHPETYWLFCNNFVKAAVGDEAWRTSLSKNDPNQRMASVQNEAFAMVMLKNNYYAWLLQAKIKHPTLITEYDQLQPPSP